MSSIECRGSVTARHCTSRGSTTRVMTSDVPCEGGGVHPLAAVRRHHDRRLQPGGVAHLPRRLHDRLGQLRHRGGGYRHPVRPIPDRLPDWRARMNDYWVVLDERAMLGDPDEATELEVFGAEFPTREELEGWRDMGAVLAKEVVKLLV